ncbi:MAG: hypothetical protein MI975_28330 [Cytophagales bacterium]|nr:hypothetical protein [Cytophagales bacterium]
MISFIKHNIRVSILVIGLSGSVFAQDGHYWTEQFGNKSMLLSGTVNASVKDLGLVYYNPGRLSQIENPAFVISARVYEINTTRITDGLGTGNDLKKTNFGGAPNLVAGTFKLPFLKDHHFAYSFLTRFRNNSEFDIRSSETGQEVNEVYYDNLSSKLKSGNNLQQEWFGLTWSYGLNDHLSIGLSTFGTITNNSNALEIRLQGLTDSNEVHMVNFNRELSLDVYGILWKAGLAGNWDKINIGLTVTTPGIKISGKGSSVYEDYITGLSELENEPVEDTYIEDYQEDLDAQMKSPLSVGLGVSFNLNNSIFHLSSEWFNKIDPYTLMEVEPFLGQSTGDTIHYGLVDNLKSVFNFGVGFEHYFNEKVEVYGGVSTDFSAVNSDDGFIFEFDDNVTNSTFDGDIYHFGGGFALNLTWAELTLGATYASSSRQIPRPLNIGGDELLNSDEVSDLKYGRWRFIVGFSFPFVNKISDNLNFD